MNRISALASIVFIACLVSVRAQTSEATAKACGFEKQILDPLIDDAERSNSQIGHVYFVGTTYTRDREIRRRLAPGTNEGDVFTRRGLERSLRNVSNLKSVYPIVLENVEMTLDRANGWVDIVICVVQKPRLL